MTKTLPQKMVQYVEETAPLLKKAAEAEQIKQATDQAVAELIPGVVETLIQHKRIDPLQKAAAEQALQDPVKALQILQKVAAHRNQAEVPAMGQPTPSSAGQVKQASRRELAMAAADRRYREALGLPVDN